jgi:hypothetical protein
MKYCLIIIAALFSAGVFAKCENGSKTVFLCTTPKGKQIELCDAGKIIEYSFGKPHKAEIIIRVPRNQVTMTPWNGMGSFMNTHVNIPNKTTVYSVYSGVYKPTSENENEPIKQEAGVEVFVNNNSVATVQCSAQIVVNELEGMDLPVSDAFNQGIAD